MTSQAEKPPIGSILPDHFDLDFIPEGSERSENSESSHSGRHNSYHGVSEQPAVVPMSPKGNQNSSKGHHQRRSPKSRGSPSRKVRTQQQQRLPPTVVLDELDEDEEEEEYQSHQNQYHPSHHNNHPGHSMFQATSSGDSSGGGYVRSTILMEVQEEDEEDDYDGSGGTEKLTEDSDNEEMLYDIAEGDEDQSEGSMDQVPHLGDLAAALSSPKKSSNLRKNEAASFDADSSVMYFDYDEEEDDASGSLDISFSVASVSISEDAGVLTWRLDPEESLSDWAVLVQNKHSGATQEYHVHKNIMAIGKRKSEYFASVFKQLRGNKTVKSTNVVLPDRAAQAMPMFLDYMYLGGTAVHISPETATGLRFLAQFFGVRNLFEKIMRYIQRSLNLKTLMTYYKGGCELEDQKILKIAAKHCARNIHLIEVDSEIITEMDPPFFSKVLSMPGLEEEEKKLHLSILVAKFCEIHKKTLGQRSFEELTSAKNLPVVHQSAAMSLLGMEADLVVKKDVASMMKMSNLQERCIRGLSVNWRQFTEEDQARTAHICRKLPANVVTELFLKSLDHTKRDAANSASPMSRQGSGRGMRREGSQKGSKAKKEEANKIKEDHEEAMAKLKAEYELKLSHLQDLCYEKDKHIKKHYEEIVRFKRLPNSYDGKLVSSGKKEQPTKMPEIGKHSTDGYLLGGRKLAGKKYPIFYYDVEEK